MEGTRNQGRSLDLAWPDGVRIQVYAANGSVAVPEIIQRLEMLAGRSTGLSSTNTGAAAPPGNRRARRRKTVAQADTAQPNSAPVATNAAPRRKRRISPAGRKAIAEAQRRRWAKKAMTAAAPSA